MKNSIYLLLFACFLLTSSVFHKNYEISYNYIPYWIKKVAKDNNIDINYKTDMCPRYIIIDMDGDGFVEAVFLQDKTLFVVYKSGSVEKLKTVKSIDGLVMSKIIEPTYWYIDDKSSLEDFDNRIKAKGQVLNLVYEGSATVSIYCTKGGYRWQSYD